MRVHIRHTAETQFPTRTVNSVADFAKKGIAKKALWVGVMPVGLFRMPYRPEPDYVGLYYHTIRIGSHLEGHGLHHRRAQILGPSDRDFEYEPLETRLGTRAILAAALAVEYLQTALPDAWEVVVTKPSMFNPDVKDVVMPPEDIIAAQNSASALGMELPTLKA